MRRTRMYLLTLVRPGDGLASVLTITESVSTCEGLWVEDPLALNGCRTDNDQTPRVPPTT
jgi:hypothetical protein